MNNILIGADEVARAGCSMKSAAEAMERAAATMNAAADKMRQVLSDFDFTIMNHQRFMTAWVQEVRDSLEEVLPDLTAPLAVRLMQRGGPDEEYVEVELEPETLHPKIVRSDRPTMPSFGVEEGPID